MTSVSISFELIDKRISYSLLAPKDYVFFSLVTNKMNPIFCFNLCTNLNWKAKRNTCFKLKELSLNSRRGRKTKFNFRTVYPSSFKYVFIILLEKNTKLHLKLTFLNNIKIDTFVWNLERLPEKFVFAEQREYIYIR